ncbi:sugar ABC transporter ATP-binding protein [Bacillaceae bacterium S4-13-58]
MIDADKLILKMRDISIEFPGVKALSEANFEVVTGSINALIGANGAGKSTLMKVLAGAFNHYTGEIFLDDEKLNIRSPKDSKNLGIDIVYQEVDTALISYLSVGENIMLDEIVNHMGKRQVVNWKEIHKKAEEALKELNINIDTKKTVMDLDLAEKQMVLIARAIVRKGKYLILDEPTAPLSTTETKELFRVVKDLAYKKNVGIIFISHRLPELFEICENITVMKDGKVVAKNAVREVTIKKVVELMLGGKFSEEYPKLKVPIGEEILNIINLNDRKGKVIDVSLKVNAGEVIGIAGLVGAGKTELCKTIFGAEKMGSGDIVLKGKKINNKSPHHSVKHGLALVPEERRKEGVLIEEPVYSNLTAANLKKYTGKFSILKPNLEKKYAREIIGDIGIKTPSEKQKVALLSGGNQQKVAVGKWLMSDADVYLLDEPTKGVDVGAKREIFQLINNLAKQEKGIIYATSELSEIMAITDRIYVMYDNKIVKELVTEETTEEEVLYYSTGGQ